MQDGRNLKGDTRARPLISLVREITLSDYSFDPLLQKRFPKEITEKIWTGKPNAYSSTQYLRISPINWSQPSLASRVMANNNDLLETVRSLVNEGYAVSNELNITLPEALNVLLPGE